MVSAARALGCVSALLALPAAAAERPCVLVSNGGTCDRIIDTTGYTSINGIGAGEVICLQGGTNDDGIQLANVVGTAVDPVLVTPCEGPLLLNDRILVNGCEHLIISGALEAEGYGIRIDATGHNVGLQIYGGVDYVEVERVEIFNSNFAGIMAKSDNLPPDSAPQHNTHLHHNYIHDIRGEGLYIGNSFYDGDEQQRLVGTRIHDNIVINSGCEAIQLGCGDEDTEIYGNYVENAGSYRDWDTDGAPWDCPVGGVGVNCFPQSNGYQMGGGTVGLFYGNVAVRTKAHGLFVAGLGDISIFNNVFVDNGDYYGESRAEGIWFSPRLPDNWPRPVSQTPAGALSLGIVSHNTIVSPAGFGYELHSSTDTTINLFQNNLVAGYLEDTVDPIESGASIKHPARSWTHEGYTHLTSVAAAQFVDPLTYDDLQAVPPAQRWQAVMDGYALQPTSPARDSGVAMDPTYAVSTDALGEDRPVGVAVDAGAREWCCVAVDDGAPGGDTDNSGGDGLSGGDGAGPGGDDTGGDTDSGGGDADGDTGSGGDEAPSAGDSGGNPLLGGDANSTASGGVNPVGCQCRQSDGMVGLWLALAALVLPRRRRRRR